MAKQAFTIPLLSAGFGALPAMALTAEDKQTLADHYGLDSDANFVLRNAGRSAVGGMVGGAAGNIAGRGVGMLIGKAFAKKIPPLGDRMSNVINDLVTERWMNALGRYGRIGGAAYGAGRSSEKYSPVEAERIRAEKAKKQG